MARPSILIIDDQEEVRDAFSRALALDAYETRTAESGASIAPSRMPRAGARL
jgi:DNA-binding NtrC family response regulator